MPLLCFVANPMSINEALKILTLPLLVAFFVIFSLPRLYSWFRQLRWKRRQEKEAEAKAKLKIPIDIKKPEEFLEIKAIDDAQRASLSDAPNLQGRYYQDGLKVVLLPSVALIILSIQLIWLTDGGGWAYGLLLTETFLLAYLIMLTWSKMEPSQEWISARIRTELLRREQYLRLAGIGPYLMFGFSANETKIETEARIKEIVSAGTIQALWRLISMQDSHGHSWFESLWQEKSNRPQAPNLSELKQRIQSYLHYRIKKQIMWYKLGKEDCEAMEKFLGSLLKLAVMLAFGAAVAHIVKLESHDPLGHIISLAAIVLPPFGTAIIGVQNLYGYRTRAGVYNKMHQELQNLENFFVRNLQNLAAQCPAQELAEFEQKFQLFALRTEQAITRELEEWLILTYRHEHEITP